MTSTQPLYQSSEDANLHAVSGKYFFHQPDAKGPPEIVSHGLRNTQVGVGISSKQLLISTARKKLKLHS